MTENEALREILGRAWAIKLAADSAICSIAAGERHTVKDFQDIAALSCHIARLFAERELLDEKDRRDAKNRACAGEFDSRTLPSRKAHGKPSLDP